MSSAQPPQTNQATESKPGFLGSFHLLEEVLEYVENNGGWNTASVSTIKPRHLPAWLVPPLLRRRRVVAIGKRFGVTPYGLVEHQDGAYRFVRDDAPGFVEEAQAFLQPA